MCKKQTSVSHSSTESEIISLDAGLRLGWSSRSWLMGSAVLGHESEPYRRGRLVKEQTWSVLHLARFTNASNLREWSMIWIMLIFFPQTSTLLIRNLCCMCLKTTKQWSRWSQREEARQWNMFPEPTELLLIGYSIESIWTPRSKSNTLTPKTNSQTYWPRGISHVMNGIIFCVWLTQAISFLQIVLKWCRKERKKIQVKKESQQNRSQWWIWSRDAAKGLLMCYLLLHQKALGKPDMKVIYFWFRGWAAFQNGETCWGRLLIKQLRMECWLNLVFSRVEIWWSDGR